MTTANITQSTPKNTAKAFPLRASPETRQQAGGRKNTSWPRQTTDGQLGFDFWTTSDLGGNFVEAIDFTEQEAGTWLAPKFTKAQYEISFLNARTAAQGLAEPFLSLFLRGLDAACARQAEILRRGVIEDRPYRFWHAPRDLERNEFEAFAGYCRKQKSKETGATGNLSIETKIREGRLGNLTAALHIRDAGTLIAQQWLSDNYSISFRPWRDTFFRKSIRDAMPSVKAPRSLWHPVYCGDKLAYSGQGIAHVPTFKFDGREYVNNSVVSSSARWSCEGWSFRALSDWNGPTYNYQSQCEAWDEGCLERGDRRGLVVKVLGQLCVFDAVTTFYDR